MKTKVKPCKFCDKTTHYPYQCRLNPKNEKNSYIYPKKVKNLQKIPKTTTQIRIKRKPIKQKGKRTIEYEVWRDTVAKPYLDAKFGRVCAACAGARCHNLNLDVDHIEERGSRPDLKMALSNVQYLGRFPCHVEKTS